MSDPTPTPEQPDDQNAAKWRAITAERLALRAVAEQSDAPDCTAIERYLVHRQKELGVYDADVMSLPAGECVAARLLVAELFEHGFVLVNGKTDPERFRDAFAIVARYSNTRLFARGSLACLVRLDPPPAPAPEIPPKPLED